MTRITSIKDIGLVYEQMKSVKNAEKPEVVEEKAVKRLESFPKAKDKKIKITAEEGSTGIIYPKNSGPEAAEGFKKVIVDPKKAKENNHYQPQKFSTIPEKTGSSTINTNMKSIFDKLFEDVMKDDALDLGVKAGPEGEAGDAADLDLSKGEDTVTVTLDKDLAQKLCDALQGVLGTEEDHSEEGGEVEGEVEPAGDLAKDEDEEEHKEEEDKKEEEEETAVAGEATELEALPDSKGQALQNKNNKVPGKLSHAKSSKASADVLKGNYDGKPSVLPDSKGHVLTSKNNKVNAPGYKPGDLFK